MDRPLALPRLAHLHAACRQWHAVLQGRLDAARPPQDREDRWRREAAAVLRAVFGPLMQRWQREWAARIRAQAPWPDEDAMVAPVALTITGPLQRYYTRLWQAQMDEAVPEDLREALVRQQLKDVRTFVQTTRRRLESQVTPVLALGAVRIAEALAEVAREADEVRGALLIESQVGRTAQAAARGVALVQGQTRAIWHVTSTNPCDWCIELDGQAFVVGEGPLFEDGETLTTVDGKEMTLGYGDVYHPPIHPRCQCVLEYTH